MENLTLGGSTAQNLTRVDATPRSKFWYGYGKEAWRKIQVRGSAAQRTERHDTANISLAFEFVHVHMFCPFRH